ncbi:sulfite exporter TauE/SafE family protein [Vulgatibacter incomptus]|uniref:Heavy-metal-associated domain protein n=1 Tax=Vulgatibacter incomptus TaxID=1391653 RepID=A0A0K1PHV1_9BACT|nr:sulfite exporter TauE/SafE family protein [Vulgatibacter incomptus]AKU92981.1 Heavy-metal-associated domain protein [Vulgatibacter incomptus]
MDLFSPDIRAAIDNPAAAVGFLAAAVVGIAGSLHCFLMCGPLACSGLATLRNENRAERRARVAAYQGGRLAAYTAVGALLGALGGGIASLVSIPVRQILPWVMAATLVATALELGKKLPAIPGVGKILGVVGRASAGFPPVARSAVIGALTPLLPCGLLYGISAAALATGSAGGGALVMGGFALGSGPALLLAQAGMGRRLPNFARVGLQRGVPLVAAAVLVYRAVQAGGADGAPSCH